MGRSEWDNIGLQADQLRMVSQEFLRYARSPVYREQPAVGVKSLPHVCTYTVELNCGHKATFINPRPLKGSVVYCKPCTDYFKVIDGPSDFRYVERRPRIQAEPGDNVLIVCTLCKDKFSYIWKGKRAPRLCQPCKLEKQRARDRARK